MPLQLDGTLVVLRDWRRDDLAPLREWLDPSHPWHETNGPYFAPPTPEGIDSEVERIEAMVDAAVLPSPRSSLAVADSSNDHRLLGQVSWYWESEETDWRRMGIVIYDDAAWGRGQGTDAMHLWTSYLFAKTDALRLDFATYSGNPAMIALGRRLGFVEEGRFRRARRWSGGVHDSVVMGVLREEWANDVRA